MADRIRDTINYIAKEWHVIKRAPAAAIFFAILAVVAITVIEEIRYSDRINSLKGENKSLEATNENLKTVNETLNQRVEFANEQLAEYRQKAGATPDAAAQKIGRLEAKVAALETQEAERAAMEWPPLSQEQIVAWTKKLFWYQGQITFLAIFYADTHSEALRASLREVFQKAGWPKPAVLAAGDREGVGVKAIPDNAAAAVLVTLFRGAGYPVATLTPREHAPSKIQIYIGRRPRSHVRN